MKKLTAILCLTIAALLGSVGVSESESESDGFDRGERAYKNGNYTTAMREFKLIAVKEGFPGAQYLVGMMYAMGKGVPKDYKTAFKWFKIAAEGGDLDAHKSLGQMYFDGMGVPQDHQMALKWYKRPAERGHADAQIALGATYAAIEDYIAAYMWNEIAAKNKQKNSGQMRNLIESKMTPDQIAEAQKLARECVRKKYTGC